MSASRFTKGGRPLQVSGDKLHSRSGTYLGRIRNAKVYDPNGRYAGTIVGDRVVYRSTDSASLIGPSVSMNRIGTVRAARVPSAIWGDEPDFSD